MNIHESHECRGRERLFLYLLSITFIHFINQVITADSSPLRLASGQNERGTLGFQVQVANLQPKHHAIYKFTHNIWINVKYKFRISQAFKLSFLLNNSCNFLNDYKEHTLILEIMKSWLEKYGDWMLLQIHSFPHCSDKLSLNAELENSHIVARISSRIHFNKRV